MPDTEYTFVHLTKYRDPAFCESGSPMQISFLASTVPVSITRYIVEGTVSDAKCMG
jgi:hypothetical protein